MRWYERALTHYSAYLNIDPSKPSNYIILLYYKIIHKHTHTCVTFSSVAQSCSVLCDPKDCTMSGFSVHHQLPELAQAHIHRVGDAIHNLNLCRPLQLPPSIFPASQSFPVSQFFASGGQSIAVSASVLLMNLRD